MRLNLPQLDPTPRGNFPFQPRKLKKWLKELPLANMGETTRLLYAGLIQANRQPCPPKRRIEIMELVRPTARIVLDNLHRHLLARSLPLPPKTRKISELRRSLLGELASGYKRPLHETVQGDGHCDTKSLALATHRALGYLGEQILMSARLYAPYPRGIWQDLYAIYHMAERTGLLERSVKDPLTPSADPSRVRDIFVQQVLLALAAPQSLRPGEAERLAAYLGPIAAQCAVQATLSEAQGQGIFHLDLSEDEPPEHSHPEDVVTSPTNRYLEIGPLLAGLHEQTHHRDTADPIVREQVLGGDLAERLLARLTAQPRREHGRNRGVREVYVAIGLGAIYDAIARDPDNPAEGADLAANATGNPLSLVPETSANPATEGRTVDPDRTRPTLASSAWEMVARGNVITSQPPMEHPGRGAELPNPAWQRWQMLNYSAGGARLCWCKGEPCHAQVGELLALREHTGKDLYWRVGVIRWMQNSDTHGLDVGIQLLSTHTLPALVETQQRDTAVVRALISATEDAAKAALFLAPGSLGKGDKLRVRAPGLDKELELTEPMERTASFTQYRYRSEGGEPQASGHEPCDPTQQDFDTLWSML